MLGVQENSLRIGCLRLLADDNQDVEVRSPEDDHRKKDKATRREEYDREASQPAHPSSRYPHDQIGIKLMMMIKSGNIPTSCTTRPFVPIDSREGGILMQVPNRKEGRLSSISISWEFEFLHHDRTLLQQQQQTAIGRTEEENRYLNHDRGVSLQHSCWQSATHCWHLSFLFFVLLFTQLPQSLQNPTPQMPASKCSILQINLWIPPHPGPQEKIDNKNLCPNLPPLQIHNHNTQESQKNEFLKYPQERPNDPQG